MKKSLLLVALLSIAVLGTGFAFAEGGPFQRDPVRLIVWLLDFRLNLTDTQEASISAILKPVVAELRAKHIQHKAFAESMAAKIGEGTLSQADIVSAMELRQKTAQENRATVAATIFKVYQILTPAQRQTISANMQKRLALIGSAK